MKVLFSGIEGKNIVICQECKSLLQISKEDIIDSSHGANIGPFGYICKECKTFNIIN
jgi:hypothetical protein